MFGSVESLLCICSLCPTVQYNQLCLVGQRLEIGVTVCFSTEHACFITYPFSKGMGNGKSKTLVGASPKAREAPAQRHARALGVRIPCENVVVNVSSWFVILFCLVSGCRT